MAKPLTPAEAVVTARSALASIEAQHGELSTKRRAALLNGASTAEIAKLDAEIEKLAHAAQTERDRIALLEVEVERLAKQRQAKELQEQRGRVQGLFAKRDAAGAKIAQAVADLDKAFRECITIGRQIDAAWPWPSHDRPVIMATPGTIHTALVHELYRVGSRPQRFGGFDAPDAGLHLPGAKSARWEWAGQPEMHPKFVDVLANATAYASRVMNGDSPAAPDTAVVADTASPAPAPAPVTQPSSAQAVLLKRLEVLSLDPAKEAEYMSVVKELESLAAGEMTNG